MKKTEAFFISLKEELKEDEPKFYSLYKMISIVGQGAFGIVLHCKDRSTNEDCAVKVLKRKLLYK